MKSNNSFDEQQMLFDFINNNEISTDPVFDDTKKSTVVQRQPYKKNGEWVTPLTESQRKEVNKENLQQKKQNDLFYNADTTQADNTPRILTDIRPINQFANYLPKTTARILNGIRIEAKDIKTADYYLQHGSNIKDIITNETQKLDAINALEKWKLSNYIMAINDLCGGLTKQLSLGVQFEGIKPQWIVSPYGEKIITSWLVTMTWKQVLKCAFGGLVDKFGNYKYGTSDILKHTTEKELINFINQKIPPAILQYFFKSKDGLVSHGEYAPIRIYDKNNHTVTFELDRRYFPFDFTDNGEPCGIANGARYMIDIAGVSSVLEIGHFHIAHKGIENLPSTLVANRFYLTLMGAFQFQSLLGIRLKNNFTDKENIATRKNGIFSLLGENNEVKRITQSEAQKNWTEKRTSADIEIQRNASLLEYDLFPKDIKKRQWSNVQEKGKLIGDMLIDGLQTTGLFDELKSDPNAKNILVPSNKTGMQYLEQYPNLLLAKVEPITKL